jgi:SAM-dependent methyltransferase
MSDHALVLASELYAAALDDSPYFRFFELSPVTRILQRTIPRHLRPGATVLDMGCGNAIGACHLAAAGGVGLTYVGIDPDPAACEWARHVLASLPAERVQGRILEGTLEEYLAAASSKFDVILSSWAFRCCVDLRRPDTHESTATAIAEVLAPEGTLLVGDAFIAPGATDEEIERIRRHHDSLIGARATGHPVFPPELIETLFARAGLFRAERHDVLALALGQFLGMPHDRYCLQVFRRAAVKS